MKLRFVRKTYGRGWTPATRQGRTVLAIYIFWLVYWTQQFSAIDSVQHSVSDTLINFLPPIFIATVCLLLICYRKGESPKRQRGKKNK